MSVAVGFNAATRRFLRRLPSMSFSPDSTVQQDLPQVGFLSGIVLQVRGTTTTAAASSATAQTYPRGAQNIIRRVRLSTNEGADIVNVSGQGLYLVNRVLRTGFDPFSDFPDQVITGVTNPFSRYTVNPTDLGANASQTWRHTFYVPVAWTLANLQGMLLAQNLGVRFTLSVDWGNLQSLYSATTGTVTLSGVEALPQLVLFALPDAEVNFPDLRFVHTWVEETPPLQSADYVFRPKLGNIYLRIIEEFLNSSGAAFVPIGGEHVTLREFSYAQVQNIESTTPDLDLYWQRLQYGADLPPGVYVREWQNGNGVIELGNTRDAVDSAQITDMQLRTVLSSSLTLGSSAFVRTISEQLIETQG